MKDNEKFLDDILKKIVEEISITPTMRDKATESYEAVGKWIGEGLLFDVKIQPQGSMNLGTTIKPISDNDDYDIDLVCLLEDGKHLTAKQIKNIVGNRLKENEIYRQKIEEEGEGKRCWKLQYYEFHMDILPCVPRDSYEEPNNTEIRITHKNAPNIYVDKFSNPFGYRNWFRERMTNVLRKAQEAYALDSKVEIDSVPMYRVKTPLQMAIQLLKRHRDVCFKDNPDDAPISIIITTLASHAYNGESSLYEAICNILKHMTDYIEYRKGVYWIANPVMQEENFADKWIQYPERRLAFLKWINRAQKELIDNPLNTLGIDQLIKHYSIILGDAPVKRAFKNLGQSVQNARESNNLYSRGLTKGLVSSTIPVGKLVKNHTFYD
ncbi:MAG: nucleotidyltransferase [Oxalobacter sp.]|nr:nucleotidyltransferase [Oxalobacter sp.]